MALETVDGAGPHAMSVKKRWMALHYAERGASPPASPGASGAGSLRSAAVAKLASGGSLPHRSVSFAPALEAVRTATGAAVKEEREAQGECSANGASSVEASDTGSAARSPGAADPAAKAGLVREASSPVCASPKLGWKQAARAEAARRSGAAATPHLPPPPPPAPVSPSVKRARAEREKQEVPSPKRAAVTSPRAVLASPRAAAASAAAAPLTEDEKLALELHRQMNCTPARRSRARDS